MDKKVAVIMGSDSDFPVVSAAVKKLKGFGIPVEVHVCSAHRTPEQAADFSKNAAGNGFGVMIAAAGKAAQEAVHRLLRFDADDRLVRPRHAKVGDKAGAFWENLGIGGRHVGDRKSVV